MSKTKKIISLVLVAMLVMAMATVAIVSASALAEGDTYIVAGSGALCGSEWDPADTNNQMTWNADKSVYEKVYTNVAAGTYNYKVVHGTTWGDAYTEYGPANSMGDDGVITVDADGSTVTLTFNGGNVEIAVTAGSDTPVDPTPTDAPVDTPTDAPVDTPTDAPVDTPTDAPVVGGDTITVYFTNNWVFADQYIHFWGGSATSGDWPGVAMTFVETNENGENIYSAEIPADTTGIVFNGLHDQDPNVRRQTVDITEFANNMGFYCVEEVDGKITVGTYEYIVTEPTDAPATDAPATDAPATDAPATDAPATDAPATDAPATDAPATDAPATDAPATDAPTTDAPAVGNGVTVDGTNYPVAVGDIITYTYKLTTPSNIENVQATTYYSADKLELIPNDGAASFNARVMFPVLRDMSSVIFNTDIPGEVKFNSTEGVDAGFDFTAGDVLVTLQFKVLDASASEIYTVIEEMVKFGEKVDYATGGQIVADGVTGAETLTGNTDTPATDAPATDAPATDAPATDAPATDAPATDAPATDAPATDAPATDAPATDAPATDAPATDAPATDAPATDAPATDAPATDAPATDAPVVDPTSVTDAPATQAPTNAPNTGAAAYIYVVVAVLAMAACAVVVLRKRVNG